MRVVSGALVLLVAAAAPAAGRLHGAIAGRGLGGDYCTREGPDFACYPSGFPACCGEANHTAACPDDRPPCETPYYCESEPDEACYAEGWPACCGDGGCPPERPECDVYTTTTTTTFTTTTTTTEAPYQFPEQGPPEGEVDDPSEAMPAEGFVPPYCNDESNYECYSDGKPACCEDPDSCTSLTSPPCEVTSTSSTTPDDLPMELPSLTLPEGGLHEWNDIIPVDYPDNIIPKEVVQGVIDAMLGDSAALVEGLVLYDVRARKVCASCDEMIQSWETNDAFASEVMPYCAVGSFAYGRTMSGLLLEPIDPTTKEPIVGKVAATIYSFPTSPDPFSVPSQWPSNIATNPNLYTSGLFPASAGTYTLIPDVLGNGEDWENARSFIVKAVYQASAVPLLLKLKDDIEKEYECTELDKRVNIMGFSEGGYATIAISRAIDMLDDGWVHTYTGVGGAPIKLASEQMYGIVKMHEGTYPLPQYLARFPNAYSSTNGDLVNSNAGQDMAAEEYLDPVDEAKDIREWSRAGLSYAELLEYMPRPPTGSFTDVLNPDFLAMVLSSFAAGDRDPCNSEFRTESVDALCEAILDNDLSDILMGFDYPVVLCHSPDDDTIYYANVPNTTSNDNLIMIEDVPGIGDVVKPRGNHSASASQCGLGFILAFVAPPEISDVRAILLIEDGTCGGEGLGTSMNSTTLPSPVEGVTANASMTPPGPDDVATGTMATSSSDGVTISTTPPSATGVVVTTGTSATSSSNGVTISTTLPSATGSIGGVDETGASSSDVEDVDPSAASAAYTFGTAVAAVAVVAAASAFAAVAA